MTKEQIAAIWDRYFEIVSSGEEDVVAIFGEPAEKLKALIAEAPYQANEPGVFRGFWTFDDDKQAFEVMLHVESGESAICDADMADVDLHSDRLEKLRFAKIRELLTEDEIKALVACATAADSYADDCESRGDEDQADHVWNSASVLQKLAA